MSTFIIIIAVIALINNSVLKINPAIHNPISESYSVYKYLNVKEKVYIGSNSTILPELTIGEKSVVGAGSVVTKSVAPDVIVKGIPAK